MEVCFCTVSHAPLVLKSYERKPTPQQKILRPVRISSRSHRKDTQKLPTMFTLNQIFRIFAAKFSTLCCKAFGVRPNHAALGASLFRATPNLPLFRPLQADSIRPKISSIRADTIRPSANPNKPWQPKNKNNSRPGKKHYSKR